MGALTKVGTVMAISVAMLFASIPLAAAKPANPFVGSWENVDLNDGSHQRLSIGGGPGHFTYRDDAASACRDAGLGFVAASLRGFGDFVGTTTFEINDADLYCHPAGSPQLLFGVSLTFTYDSASDTLSDTAEPDQGCWYRSGHPEACAVIAS